MQRIIIKNFGPISDIELDVKDFLIFIGPQASGKSTISKSIYFFKSLRDDLIRYIFESVEKKEFDKPLGTYAKTIRKKFLSFWGPTQHLQDIFIQYNYNEDIYINITLERTSKYVTPNFSQAFKKGFTEIVSEVLQFLKTGNERDPKFLSSSELLAIESEKREFYNKIQQLSTKLFAEGKDLIFIPAGRSLLATLSDQLHNIHPHKMDYLMMAFQDRINNSRALFNKSLPEMVTEKKKLTRDIIDTEAVSMAQKIIENILKGSYRFDREGEKLYFDQKKYTRLNFSSSGQQESLWILLLIFLIILENKAVFVVVEEPEAHLYPEAQKNMVDLISLLANYAHNQIIITTHSPYILSSVNNLMYAWKIGENSPKKVSPVINQRLWMDRRKLGAYFIEKGTSRSIVDEELELIQAEAIDSASQLINEEYDFLFNLDETSM
jgi:predicted ATPase